MAIPRRLLKFSPWDLLKICWTNRVQRILNRRHRILEGVCRILIRVVLWLAPHTYSLCRRTLTELVPVNIWDAMVSDVGYSTSYMGYSTLCRKSAFLHRIKISCFWIESSDMTSPALASSYIYWHCLRNCSQGDSVHNCFYHFSIHTLSCWQSLMTLYNDLY